jgi:hypothetical protein
MSRWVRNEINGAINIDNLCHIWVEQGINGYFLMGEMIQNAEEVIVSRTYSTEEEVLDLLISICRNGA